MKRLVKLILIPLLITAIVYIVILGIKSIGADNIVINEYYAEITFNEAGDMTVTETFDMNYKKALRVRFRDIDYTKFYDDYPFEYDTNYSADFISDESYMRFYKNGVNVTNQVDIGYSWNGDYDELGNRITCEPLRSDCASMFVDSRDVGGLNGNVKFEYHYVIEGVATRFDDISEINWNLFEYMESGITQGEVRINLPQKDLSLDNFYIFSHGMDDMQAEFLSDHEAVITFENSDKKDFLEFRILVPNRLFPDMDNSNVDQARLTFKSMILDYEQDLAEHQATGETSYLLSWIIAIAFGPFFYLCSIFFYHKFFKPYHVNFDQMYLRDVPYVVTPAEMSYLFYGGIVNDEDVTATLLDLIRRKYIKIEYDPTEITDFNPKYKLVLLKNPKTKELKSHETHLLRWFFETIGDQKQVTSTQIEDYPQSSYQHATRFKHDAQAFKDRVKSAFNVFPFMFLDREKKIASSLIYIGVIAIFYLFIQASIYSYNVFYQFLCILLFGIFYYLEQNAYIKRTKEAREAQVKWEAFRRFLLDFGTFEDDPITNVIIWEKYLVYATSFKIADLVMKQFKVDLNTTDLNQSDATFLWFNPNQHNRLFNPMHRFNRNYVSMRQSANHAIRAHNREVYMQQARERASSRSSGGFGGGRSGGSSFGGGGGGGRSR
ncbi:MAG: DUF2207 domain-containing protein [Acholeplasmataceae bacterium]|nr:DUF2207 domain-containing protein [Acholeplasmataceae bacterium]